MSSVAEALLASGSKKLALLPPPPKIKKDPPTFCFDLELAESNERTYPEFSWSELVRNSKQGELAKKIESGAPTLNPYASDDEDDLKAMAAKFEAKYAAPTNTKKKKRRAEDYIDRGAGYDESDPFIDNSEIYDEIVPPDLQTAHGGFYINSGSLDFKEVELSEDDDSQSSPAKMPKVIKKAKVKITPAVPFGVLPKKNPVGRPPAVGIKRPSLTKEGLVKKRKLGPDGQVLAKPKTLLKKPGEVGTKPEFNPKTKMRIESSSSSSSSSSEESSSSDSESSSAGETEKKEVKTPKEPPPVLPKITPTSLTNSVPKLLATPNTVQIKRVKTKNVPLNPKLHPGLPPPNSAPPPIVAHAPPKPVVKADLKSPRVQSPVQSPALKPKPSPTISPATACLPQQPRPLPAKPKPKKLPPPQPTITPQQYELYQQLAGYSINLPALPQTTSILKNGVNILSNPKAMPNLKKMTPTPGEKLVHTSKTPKSAPPKTKRKQVVLPSTPTHVFNPPGAPSYAPPSISPSYKTPPPLAGPGVEIQKVRSNTSTSKASFTPSSLGLATISSSASLTSSILTVGGITSILNSSPSTSLASVPSSLSVQRIPQSITITPTQPSIFPTSLASITPGKPSEPKVKHAFDMQSLLQSPYSAQILMAASKAAAGAKPSISSNARDLQRK